MNIEILNFLDSLISKMEVVSSGLARIYKDLIGHLNMKKLMTKTARQVIIGSFQIWCSSNKTYINRR